jgi:hypothetical protein
MMQDKTEAQEPWHRQWRWSIVALTVFLVAPFATAIAFLAVYQWGYGYFPMPAQDCESAQFPGVEGYIVDTDSNPIEGASVRVTNKQSRDHHPFDYTVTSDDDGYFFTNEFATWECARVRVIVTADGYRTARIEHWAGFFGDDGQPDPITIELEPR